MAKTAVDGGGLPAGEDELKKELQRTVNSIVEDDDYSLEAIDRAMQCLCALEDLKLNPNPPHEFVCPLSHQLMKDPVVLASGWVSFNLSFFYIYIFLLSLQFIHFLYLSV